ncbi:MAG: DNA cytosine methyltransferase [Acidobacteriia bacterium]|nr:DNA cytosine methyltransferase [Terriglobia bacterium]
MRAVELFVGAGGLALGVSAAGFGHEALVEWDADACETIRENQRRGVHPTTKWPVHEMDVADFDYMEVAPGLDLLAGGPPCQPFSLGGKHRGHRDTRNLWPEALRAVRALHPKALLFENVKGLARPSFSDYFEYIRLQLAYPEFVSRKAEGWQDHLGRLRRHEIKGRDRQPEYAVRWNILNAADYGVPQRRERVFIVAVRSDLGIAWSFPDPTHSQDALLRDQWVTGEYWERHGVSKRRRPKTPEQLRPRIDKIRSLCAFGTQPWRTVRDALLELPDPGRKTNSEAVLNHRFNPGARAYPGHTGSPLDEPAKALKAGVHGVPGGENMLAHEDGTVRYFTVRECARIQTFPDRYSFHGCWSEAMRQLGNAVPVELARCVATEVRARLERSHGKATSADRRAV